MATAGPRPDRRVGQAALTQTSRATRAHLDHAGGRAGPAGPQVGAGPSAGLSPARRTHPRPHHPLPARPTAGPRRRDHRPHLTDNPPRTPAPADGHLHRPRRHLTPDHPADQTLHRRLRQARPALGAGGIKVGLGPHGADAEGLAAFLRGGCVGAGGGGELF